MAERTNMKRSNTQQDGTKREGTEIRRVGGELFVSLMLCLLGVAVNLIGNRIAGAVSDTLFLDSIGTVAAAMVGGAVPGIVVGYITNLANTFFDPVALYYGVVNVLIAVCTAKFTEKKWFESLPKTLLAIIILALMGGGVSSVITWWQFGFGFSGGISTPLAEVFYGQVTESAFLAQFMADFLVDLNDKAIVVVVAMVIAHFMPDSMKQDLQMRIWLQKPLGDEELKQAHHSKMRVVSVRAKIVAIFSSIMVVVGVVTTTISYAMFNSSMLKERSANGDGIAALVKQKVDVDRINDYLREGEGAEGYRETELAIAEIRDSFPDVSYIYIYKILDEGCQVVFDPDSEDAPGSDMGDIIEFDADFANQLDALKAGEEIEPVVSDTEYGWLLSVYVPLYDSEGVCQAYVGIDISMEKVVADGYSFLTSIISLCIAFFITTACIAVWLSDYGIVLPLNSMAMAANGFAYDSEDKRDESVEKVRDLGIRTGDEIESLYEALTKTVEDSVEYIADAARQAQTIERMQSNLIMVMADLVESRDQFTGEHVRKTAAYVEVTMNQMRKEGIYADVLTDDFIYNVVHSAPLHDIGKIVVSDTILNKPGRLTEEEFHIMQRHTVAGAKILESAVDAMSDPAYLDEARRLAIAHHEKWNGTGYPYGLAGEEIPLSARIMAVADVFDALVSKRSYKDGFPIEKALDIIREGSGTHFDPLVAKAFLDAEDEVRVIASQHGDDKGIQTFDVHEVEAPKE